MKPLTKKDFLVESIREKILAGEIRPGERLLQRELAEMFDTSVTPVREALRQLESEGMITYSAHHGARVVTISPQDAVDICQIRATLEGLALELAFPHLNSEKLEDLWRIQAQLEDVLRRKELAGLRKLNHRFHCTIIGHAQNPHLLEVTEQVWGRLPWNVLPAFYAGASDAIMQHHNILGALENRDLSAATRANRDHIMSWGYFLKEYLQDSMKDD